MWMISQLGWGYLIRVMSMTVILLQFAHPFPERGMGRGAPCKSHSDCNRALFLECVNVNCDCRPSLGWLWVEEEQSCMLMEGSPCERSEGKCLPNSSCLENKCECDEPIYLRDGFGRCERGWGESCSEVQLCARRYSLECAKTEGGQQSCRCQGEGEAYMWHEGSRKCVSMAGGPCDLEDDAGFGRDDQLDCIPNSHCVQGKSGRGLCKCNSGFKQSGKGLCLLRYGQPCDGSAPMQGQPCNRKEGLICRDGKCDCEFYGQMAYDEESQQCRVLIGESCLIPTQSNNQSVPNCAKDSFCKPRRGSTNKGTCTCLPGFDVSPDHKTCTKFKGHGQPCSTSIDCDKSRFMECVFGMTPDQSGRCICLRNHMDWDRRRCRVQPGKSCLHNTVCAEHSYCEGEWCVCQPGYVIVDTECVKANQSPNLSLPHPTWTTSSRPFNSCQQIPERTMEWKKCQCQLTPSTHIWVANESSCLGLVGTACQIDSNCIPHAVCDHRENMCQCSPSSLTTQNLECLPSSSTSSSSVKQLPREGVDQQEQGQRFHDCPEMHTLRSVRLIEDDDASVNWGNKSNQFHHTDRVMACLGGLLTLLLSVIMSEYQYCG